MKRQGVEKGRDRGPGTRDQSSVGLSAVLRAALPPVDGETGPRDLWPQMQARLRDETEAVAGLRSVPWFDWALAGGVAVFAVAFPAAVPVLLYYL